MRSALNLNHVFHLAKPAHTFVLWTELPWQSLFLHVSLTYALRPTMSPGQKDSRFAFACSLSLPHCSRCNSFLLSPNNVSVIMLFDSLLLFLCVSAQWSLLCCNLFQQWHKILPKDYSRVNKFIYGQRLRHKVCQLIIQATGSRMRVSIKLLTQGK